MTRDDRGRIVGGPMDQELKDRISAGQVERHRRQRAAVASVDPPDRKRCSNARCKRAGKWLRVPDDFYMRRRKLKSGGLRVYPSGECKECSRARADRWKKALGPEEAKRRQDGYNAKRDQEKKKRYNREYLRLKAAEAEARGELVRRGPWHRYRDEPQPRVLVPARAFIRWYVDERTRMDQVLRVRGLTASFDTRRSLREHLGIGPSTHARLEALSELLPEDLLTKSIDVAMVDRVLTKVGRPELLDELTDWRRMA